MTAFWAGWLRFWHGLVSMEDGELGMMGYLAAVIALGLIGDAGVELIKATWRVVTRR